MLLVVIHNFHIIDPIIGPLEADAPLIVDPNAELISSCAFETLQSIAWRYPQTVEVRRGMKLEKLSSCDSFDVHEFWHASALEKSFSVSTGK